MKRLLLLFIPFVFFLGFFGCNNQSSHDNYPLPLYMHTLPVISILADSVDLFDDSLGIYVKGIGNAENWQGERANYFSGKKINIDFAYFLNAKKVLQQKGQLKVSGGGSRKQPQKSFNISSKLNFKFKFFKNLNIL